MLYQHHEKNIFMLHLFQSWPCKGFLLQIVWNIATHYLMWIIFFFNLIITKQDILICHFLKSKILLIFNLHFWLYADWFCHLTVTWRWKICNKNFLRLCKYIYIYIFFSRCSYKYLMVNHKFNFVDTKNGCHTKPVAGIGGIAKWHILGLFIIIFNPIW